MPDHDDVQDSLPLQPDDKLITDEFDKQIDDKSDDAHPPSPPNPADVSITPLLQDVAHKEHAEEPDTNEQDTAQEQLQEQEQDQEQDQVQDQVQDQTKDQPVQEQEVVENVTVNETANETTETLEIEKADELFTTVTTTKAPSAATVAAVANSQAIPIVSPAAVATASAANAIHLQAIQATAAAYHTFAPLAPNATPMMAHHLVPVQMGTARRAVRIAPLGAIPLPPCGTNTIIPDISNNTTIMGVAGETGVEGHAAPVGEVRKGKRRGAAVTGGALTTEERTKQKRMLRNRESAARSRDKRKTRNLELESSIAKHKAKREAIQKNIEDLERVVETMDLVLRKHNITIPT